MLPGTPARASHDYVRHGTSSLLPRSITTAKVIGSLHAGTAPGISGVSPANRCRSQRPRLHLVLDKPPRTKPRGEALANSHPACTAFHADQFIVAQPRRTWFAELTTETAPRHPHSVRQLNTDIRAWIQTWNDTRAPTSGTKDRRPILASIGNYCDELMTQDTRRVPASRVRTDVDGHHVAVVTSPASSIFASWSPIACCTSRRSGRARRPGSIRARQPLLCGTTLELQPR